MGGGGVWYSLYIKNLAHYSSHYNFGLFIKNKTNYSLKVRKVAKKSVYSLFIIFFFDSLKNKIVYYFLGPHYSLFIIFLAHCSLFIIKKGHYSLIIIPQLDPHTTHCLQCSNPQPLDLEPSTLPPSLSNYIYMCVCVWCSARRTWSWVRVSLEAKYLQHLSAHLIHYIPLYLSTV